MIDTEGLYFQAERDIALTFGRTVTDETLWKMMGKKPIEGMEIFVRDLGLSITPSKAAVLRNQIIHAQMRRNIRAMPGLYHIIGRFHGRLKLAISTGSQWEQLNLALESLDLRDPFEVLQSSDEITRSKPDPEIFLRTCRKLGLNPQQCIVLEDSQNGVEAGRSAGCYTIAVPSDYTKGQDFSAANFVARDLYRAADHIAHLIPARRPGGGRLVKRKRS
jgi:HAD superfamily hydrolase (TIGR01509 family)